MATYPRFQIGQVVATPGALQAMTHPFALECLDRHIRGDWGNVPPEDARENNAAVRLGNRILSSYDTPQGVTIWVITEADRSVTTFLLPEEY